MSEQADNLSPSEELPLISEMLKAAHKQGLLVEVVWSYGDFRAGGDSVATACNAALYQWDI